MDSKEIERGGGALDRQTGIQVQRAVSVDVSITFVQLTPRRSPFRYAALATSPYIRSGRSPYQDPLYGASVVKRRFSFFSTLSLSPILLFGPGGAILPPRPLVPSAGARSGGQGWPAFGPPRQRRAASLTAASTTAGCVDSGATHFALLVRAFRNRAKGAGRRTVAESGLGLTSRVMRQLQPTKSEASSPLRWGADRAPRPCIRSILWGSNEP